MPNIQERGSTDPSLLARAGRGEDNAWQRLVDLYGPLVWSWCVRAGVPEAERGDVLQDVFTAVFQALPRFDRTRAGATFRGWLLTITVNKCRDRLRRLPPAAVPLEKAGELPDGESSLAELESAGAADGAREELLQRILAFLREDFAPQVWQAFWHTAVEGLSAPEAAQRLGMTPTAVRTAKARVLQRLRQEFGDQLD